MKGMIFAGLTIIKLQIINPLKTEVNEGSLT